jgi:hypothetical protein
MISREQASIELLAILERYGFSERRLLPFTVPEQDATVRWVLCSNDELATTLKHLRNSYCALLAGNPVKDDDEILAMVEASLKNAAKAKSIV